MAMSMMTFMSFPDESSKSMPQVVSHSGGRVAINSLRLSISLICRGLSLFDERNMVINSADACESNA